MPHNFAVETGLSSDPEMNWRLSMLDDFAIVSNSDAHSGSKLAREATGGKDRSAFPTLVSVEDSDTAYMTDRAIEFMDQTGDRPWFLHLSYFKPHLPIVAPYPYNEMYDPSLSPERNREEEELADPLPLHIPYRIERRSVDYDEESVWRQRRATYYGLIREIDDHLGRLFAWMKERGLWEKTLICFTSDHGEYVGDHWMFEKELFYDEAYRIPYLSLGLVSSLRETYPDSDHVFNVDFAEGSNRVVWEFVLSRQFTIVTKDGDFADLITLLGFPPRVIWIRRGNCSADETEELLRTNLESIRSQHASQESGLLVIL